MDWQVESGSKGRVFLSATSSDLGECRRRVSEILVQGDILPIAQDFFGPDPRTIEALLKANIQRADAVICLVGHVFGAAPTTNAELSSRSYTQMEYKFAEEMEKPIYIFVATDEFAKSHPVSEDDVLRARQESHRKAILTGVRKYQFFSSLSDLEGQIHALIRPILANSGRRSIKFIHPPKNPACFVGRTDEKEQLIAAINKPLPAVIVVLGMGGQGKTTLLARALREQNSLPFAAGIWVSAEFGGFTFSEFLDCALTEFMGPRFNKADMSRLDTRIRQTISILQTRPLLIVIDAIERWLTGWLENPEIDGLHNLSLRQGACEGLDEFLKQASALENGSHVILTSRAFPAALDTVECAVLPVLRKESPEIGLRSLSPDAAVEMLEQLGMVAPREKLLELARSLVFHPLALEGFACIAKRVGKDWEMLMRGIGTDPSKAFHSLVDEIRKHLPNRTYSESLLKYISLLSEGATLEMIHWLLKNEEIDGLAGKPALLMHVLALSDWNLLIWDAQTQSVRLHALVAEYFSELIPESDKARMHSRAATWYETQANGNVAMAATASHRILALRHAISAGECERALEIMFNAGRSSVSLYDWYIFNGHLWECAELLSAMKGLASGLNKVHCILARSQILHDLELSNRALIDIQEARALILSQRPPLSSAQQSLLGRCFGFEGLIHNETGKSTDALPLLDKAVSLFEPLAPVSGDSQLDLARTLANRGLAKWNCGDWDGADTDYERTIELLQKSELANHAETKVMVHEIRSRLAVLHLDSGDPASAARVLEDVILQLETAQGSFQGRPDKNYMLALIALATTHIVQTRSEPALEVLRKVILPLEELARQGHCEYNNILAYAHAIETQALLQLEKIADAAKASDRAVHLYEELIRNGAAHFQGQLGSALFKRAESLIRMGNELEGRSDLRDALRISQEWLRDWFGECDIGVVFTDNAIHALIYLPNAFNDEKRQILQILEQCIAKVRNAPPRFGATRRLKNVLTKNWNMLRSTALGLQIAWADEFSAV